MKHFIMQPLPASFMLISILGFIFSVIIVWPLSMTYGFTMAVIFAIWFIAAVINFTHAEEEEELDIHDSKQLI
jgi:uncharacterized membrane protein